MIDKKGRLVAWLSTAGMLFTALLLLILYGRTRYLPICLAAVQLLLPATITLSLLLFSRDIRLSGTSPEINTGLHGIKRFFSAVLYGIKRLGRFTAGLFNKSRRTLAILLIILSAVIYHLLFWLLFGRMTSVYSLSFISPVLLAVLFVVFITLEKICRHAESDDEYTNALLRNLRTAFSAGRLSILITAAVQVLKLLGFFELQRFAIIAIAVVFCYETLFILLSFVTGLVRRNFFTQPDLHIPMPFAVGASRELGIISYLEKNTGITMRSLWSMKLIKRILPFAVLLSALLFWLSTGIVQVESYQTGAVYRFGKLRDEPLSPGLHLTLPSPFDRTELYDTGTVKRITIGYISSENTDNTWTGNHGSNEYKLLLGSGNELVSINLRIEYSVSDLHSYIGACASPEKLLEAKAYELVADRTINTNLDTLLSADRAAFAESFRTELSDEMAEQDVGLEIVSVVLESIHPPVEVAKVYQELIGAEIKAATIMIEADTYKTVTQETAQQYYNSVVSSAKEERFTKVAEATASVSEFMASVEADAAYHDTYRYNKYLAALTTAYGNSKLVIIGDGIDSRNIYIGNLTVAGQGVTQ